MRRGDVESSVFILFHKKKQRGERGDDLVDTGLWVKLPDRENADSPITSDSARRLEIRGFTVWSHLSPRDTSNPGRVVDTYDSPACVHSSSVMNAFYEEVVRVGGDSTRGKLSAEKLELRKEFQRKLKSIQMHSDWFRGLKEGIRDAESAIADLVSSQGRTTFVKDVLSNIEGTEKHKHLKGKIDGRFLSVYIPCPVLPLPSSPPLCKEVAVRSMLFAIHACVNGPSSSLAVP